MKIILCQPAIKRFQWELEVLLTNLRQFGEHEVVLLFTERDFTVPRYFKEKYPECEVHTYPDTRDDMIYIPSVRPWLWWQYLAEDPSRENETYLYIDSDVIFREWLDFTEVGASANTWAGSDCDGYIGYKYIASRRKGAEIASQMAEICGITVEQMQSTPGAGAQWVITNPTAAYWKRVYEDSNRIYYYFNGVDSDIQKWTAEMWAQIWGMVREGKTVTTPKELDFIMSTNPIEDWEKTKILHNAGVTGSGDGWFFKGSFIDESPLGRDWSHIRTDKATLKYVQALQQVIV